MSNKLTICKGRTEFIWSRRHRRFLSWGGRRREQRPCIIRDYAAGLATASPTLAIDFPLQALAWEDAHGKVWLTYNAPEYLKERDGPRGIAEEHAGIAELVKKAIE